jgi:hypothetical protein
MAQEKALEMLASRATHADRLSTGADEIPPRRALIKTTEQQVALM